MRVLVLLSGGLDSTVLLHHLNQAHEVEGVGFVYGQRHAKELDHARNRCKEIGAPFHKVHLGHLKGSALTSANEAIPDGHYTDASMSVTVVPARNLLMSSRAISMAAERDMDAIALAVHAGDHAIYADCRPDFIEGLRACARASGIAVLAPFLDWSKTDIALLGSSLKVQMQETWSCYRGGEFHCGRCGTCVERVEAFKFAGVKDLTIYGGWVRP